MIPAQTAQGPYDRLGSTLFVAVLAHGVLILGVTFVPLPPAPPADLPTVNVTLLVDSAAAESEAAEANFLSTRDQQGGGDDEALRPTRTLSAAQSMNQQGTPLGADAVDAESLAAGPPPDQLLTRGESTRRIEAVPETTDRPSRVPLQAAALLNLAAPDTLAAELDDQVANASSEDNGLRSPSTRESAVAAYLVGWRQRVEFVGTDNFPAEILAGGTVTARPVVEVTINADGTLADVVLRRSSGNPRLDAAALGILEIAGPFPPLPEAMLAEFDVLRFTYEWDFSTGARAAARVR
jgi:periplasmic protein TonB